MEKQSNSYTAQLSQDHRHELLFCDRIEKGIQLDVSVDRLQSYVAFFWSAHLKQHFKEEEQVLFKGIDDVFCTKGKKDHITIITEVQNIISGKSIGQHDFLHLVASIHQHISFEERVLFPHLELLLPVERLREIQTQLSHKHQNQSFHDFEDTFWLDEV